MQVTGAPRNSVQGGGAARCPSHERGRPPHETAFEWCTETIMESAQLQLLCTTPSRWAVRGTPSSSSSQLSADKALLALQPAAGCCAIEKIISMAEPLRAGYWTCSHGCRAYVRRHQVISRCIWCGGRSCGTAPGSLRHVRLSLPG